MSSWRLSWFYRRCDRMAIACGIVAMTIRLYFGILRENAVFWGVLIHTVSLINHWQLNRCLVPAPIAQNPRYLLPHLHSPSVSLFQWPHHQRLSILRSSSSCCFSSWVLLECVSCVLYELIRAREREIETERRTRRRSLRRVCRCYSWHYDRPRRISSRMWSYSYASNNGEAVFVNLDALG